METIPSKDPAVTNAHSNHRLYAHVHPLNGATYMHTMCTKPTRARMYGAKSALPQNCPVQLFYCGENEKEKKSHPLTYGH